jgi:ribonuclease J
MNAKKKHTHDKSLVFLPLGGTGEIGMNCYCYGTGSDEDREWLMVDLGVKFGGDAEPGIDVVLPDVHFIAKSRKKLSGLVLTHAHEDHIGGVPWLWPQLKCPIYCTPFAAALLANKLKEHGLDELVKVHVIPLRGKFKVGSFDLEFVNVTHSIPEPCALLIKTKHGIAFHSGDWKIDRTPTFGAGIDEKRLAEIGEEGVDVLICDSTNVLREGFSPSERDVADALMEVVSHAKGRVAITTFASHVERVASAVRAARASGREVVLAGRAMRNTIEAARSCGYLHDAGAFLDEDSFGYLPPGKILLLCTGSQGEPRAAIARIAEDQHPNIALEKGDLVVFSSRTIPGNEKEVALVHNNLAKLDVDVLTSDEALIHTSGHPRQGELKTMYDWLKPKALVPMHGEARHLRAHANFAKASGIPQSLIPVDGHIMRLFPGALENYDEVACGRLHVDGKLVVPAEDGPAKQRRKISMVGAVFISVALDEKHHLADDPQITSDGLPAGLETELLEAAESAFESMPKPRRRDDGTVAETIRVAVRRHADQVWGKKPICKVLVQRV